MNIFESILSSINNILNYKIRSLLTILGIIIGISSVIIVNFSGEGLRSYIHTKLNELNKPLIAVLDTQEKILNLEDSKYISKLKGVEKVSSLSILQDKCIKLKNNIDYEEDVILGIDENCEYIEKLNVIKGRNFTKNDIETKAYIALIEKSKALKLFGNIDIIGKKIEINDTYDKDYKKFFTIVGVIEDKENISYISSSLIFIPVTLASKLKAEKIDEKEYIDKYFVKYNKEEINSEMLIKNIKMVLNKIHNKKEDDFYYYDYYNDFKNFNRIFSGVKAFVTFVAGISLFVAGIGIMNIMLVTVTERTKEIGIRKSLGATNKMIKLQFLIESSILSSLGGIIGAILGILLSNLICIVSSHLFKIELVSQINFYIILKLVLLSYILGVIFGVYPAGKAAKLDPVNSLRYK